MRRITIIILSAVAIIIATAGLARAGTGEQYYGSTHFNAWNGGPDVNAYGPSTANNDWSFAQGSNLIDSLVFASGGSGERDNGWCIGDSGNQQGIARAGLSPCDNGAVPWGGNIQVRACSNNANRVAFYDEHWQGYLAPSGNANGDAFYLNHQGEWCYTPQNPA